MSSFRELAKFELDVIRRKLDSDLSQHDLTLYLGMTRGIASVSGDLLRPKEIEKMWQLYDVIEERILDSHGEED